ncbi:secondary thiamine-phosphate synthase enzyme [Rhodoligotrophos appendicifer]|uniref:secondary thiamine-phosphate synthase enzyme YjbQ n=1 Tax=Rhodoligotrophos appendicifer TaxID=987056 RepID=UPI001FE27064|nr:secondary thiamine-phosphate synthase enzyme YjbQ [Rhodoligotrophos appendicifer]
MRSSEDVPLKQAMSMLVIPTRGRSIVDVTSRINDWLGGAGAANGLLTVVIRHTSASLIVQENTDPDVRKDLLDHFDVLAPRDARYRHDLEGPDDMPAHIKSALTQTSLSVPVSGGALSLGTWQAIYVMEHRDQPHQREIALHFIGSIEDKG